MADRSTSPESRRPKVFERFVKRLLVYAVLLGVAFGAGWLWQYSARRLADARAADATLRVPMLEARALLLQSRLDLQATNFGEARKNLQEARIALDRAINVASDPVIRQRLDASVTQTLEAQSRAAQLSSTAAVAAASACADLDTALGAMPRTSLPE